MMEKTTKDYTITHGTQIITLGELVETLDSLKKYVVDLNIESLPKSKYGSIAKFYEVIKKSKNLIRDYSDEESELLPILMEMIFGQGGDKKSLVKKSHHVERLLHNLSDGTFESLVGRYVCGEEYPDVEDILNGDRFVPISLEEGVNGIRGEDILNVYNFDSTIGSGLQQRGRGETLFSLAFNTEMNLLAGGDVKCRKSGRIVEIKSTNNAGITPKSGDEINPVYPIDSKVVQIMREIGSKLEIDEIHQGKIQKNSSRQLIDKISLGTQESNEILNLAESLFNLNLGGDGENLICCFLLSQLDYYSKQSEEFQSLGIFLENNGFPDGVLLLDSDESGFINEKNLSYLKEHRIFPKITSSNRMEIYMFDKKTKK